MSVLGFWGGLETSSPLGDMYSLLFLCPPLTKLFAQVAEPTEDDGDGVLELGGLP